MNNTKMPEQVNRPVDEADARRNLRSSHATDLIKFIVLRFELFHDKNKDVFAIDIVTNEVRPIYSQQFKNLLTAILYEHSGISIREQSFKEALAAISGIGLFKGECRSIHRRIAKEGNDYYLDLCQPGNSTAVKISAGRWEIISKPPVLFLRSESMQGLPEPQHNGSLDTLWTCCNIPKEAQLLTLAWLAEALRPDTPFPILELLGEQGSAKSTTQTILRRLIDPNACDLRASPKQPEDLFVAAGANHVVSCENISYLSAPMQDVLCIIATGGGFAKRKLYLNFDEAVINAHNPIIINGIAAAITSQDLIDRTITVELPNIVSRVDIAALRSKFECDRGFILGALLDTIVKAMQIIPYIKLPEGENPRLFEFATFGMAIAEAIGAIGEDFLNQFNASRQESIARTIDASPVAAAVIEWFEKGLGMTKELTAKELFSEVELFRASNSDAWPRSPKGFADALRRAAPALRQLGIDCRCLGKRGSYVYWRIASKSMC